MWSFFSRDPTKDFGYDIGEAVHGLEDRSIWELHKGKKKATGDAVSIFVFESKPGSEILLETAKASLKRLKTLRHPNILSYVDSLETDKAVYLVTELVEPLEAHLTSNSYTEDQKLLAMSWGLYQITKGLSFLSNDCSLAHNNMCMASVFVDRAGEWRLGGVDYMSAIGEVPPLKTLPALEKYKPPERGDPSWKPSGRLWSGDSWGLGCLFWEVFNGELPRPASLKSMGKIHKSLASVYCELVGANANSRPNPLELLTRCRANNGFFKNRFVDTMLFLEEIQIKDATEISRFFSSLTSQIDNFPPEMCKHKILPQLVNAFEFGNAGSAVLAPMFKLGKLLDAEEYQKKIVPCVVKLFTSKDRATRAKLLQQMDQFVDHLQPSLVNDQIFPQVMPGFLDTNPTIREQTVKCMLYLAPKLNYRNLNEEMLKHFARLQIRDEQGGIRTNTTVCLGKIASYLHPQMRQKVLISAFSRAMRDPFPPARNAGILALSATQGYYSLKDCATKVLPILCPLTADPERSVRDQAFKAVSGYLGKLEKVSEDPSLAEKMEAEVNAASSSSTTAIASSWAGWAVSSLSSFYKSTGSKLQSRTTPTGRPAEGQSNEMTSPTRTPPNPLPHGSELASKPKPVVTPDDSKSDSASDFEDGWNDRDWGSMEDNMKPDASLQPCPSSSLGEGGGWDEGEWENFDLESPEKILQEPEAPSGIVRHSGKDPEKQLHKNTGPYKSFEPASTYDWSSGEKSSPSDLFSSFGSHSVGKEGSPPTQAAKPQVRAKAGLQNHASGAGWDEGQSWSSWGNTDTAAAKPRSENAQKRKEQQQRRLQERRAAKQAGGPMKLGVRKDAVS